MKEKRKQVTIFVSNFFFVLIYFSLFFYPVLLLTKNYLSTGTMAQVPVSAEVLQQLAPVLTSLLSTDNNQRYVSLRLTTNGKYFETYALHLLF